MAETQNGFRTMKTEIDGAQLPKKKHSSVAKKIALSNNAYACTKKNKQGCWYLSSGRSTHLDIERLLGELKQERDRIEEAISALQGLGKGTRPGARKGTRGRRHMSAEARARISKAMKLRWAQRKKKAA